MVLGQRLLPLMLKSGFSILRSRSSCAVSIREWYEIDGFNPKRILLIARRTDCEDVNGVVDVPETRELELLIVMPCAVVD
jgi:hypothetical protein